MQYSYSCGAGPMIAAAVAECSAAAAGLVAAAAGERFPQDFAGRLNLAAVAPAADPVPVYCLPAGWGLRWSARRFSVG